MKEKSYSNTIIDTYNYQSQPSLRCHSMTTVTFRTTFAFVSYQPRSGVHIEPCELPSDLAPLPIAEVLEIVISVQPLSDSILRYHH